MRNCFVPNCDKECKYDKRMMFLPPKNPELFEKWKIILPKKRQFKKTDKVCSRHFLKEDIITTWDNVINGKLVQLVRDKPRLKDSAIPGLNLSADCEYKIKEDKYNEEDAKKARTAKAKTLATLIRSPLNKSLKRSREPKLENISTETIIVNTDTTVTDLEEFVVIAKAPELRSKYRKAIQKIDPEEHVISNLNEEDFENLYDSIFEVTLPNCLWGFHRCPLKSFIAITKFDQQSMFAAKVIFIKNNFSYELHENGQNRKAGVLTAANSEDLTESLNDLLSNFDEDKILLDDNIEFEVFDN